MLLKNSKHLLLHTCSQSSKELNTILHKTFILAAYLSCHCCIQIIIVLNKFSNKIITLSIIITRTVHLNPCVRKIHLSIVDQNNENRQNRKNSKQKNKRMLTYTCIKTYNNIHFVALFLFTVDKHGNLLHVFIKFLTEKVTKLCERHQSEFVLIPHHCLYLSSYPPFHPFQQGTS